MLEKNDSGTGDHDQTGLFLPVIPVPGFLKTFWTPAFKLRTSLTTSNTEVLNEARNVTSAIQSLNVQKTRLCRRIRMFEVHSFLQFPRRRSASWPLWGRRSRPSWPRSWFDRRSRISRSWRRWWWRSRSGVSASSSGPAERTSGPSSSRADAK